MSEPQEIRKVQIDPIGCYREAFDLVQGRYWLLLGISVIAVLIGGAVPVVLIGPMMCGVYICFLEVYRGNDFEFERLFKGFDFFVPSLVASLIMTGIALIFLVPGFLVMFFGMFASIAASQGDGRQPADPSLAPLAASCVAMLLFFVLMLAIGVFFMFTFQLIVDRKLTGTAALTTSARAVARNFGGALALMLINMALSVIGVLACYVGTFFITPISFAAMTIAYRKVFPEIAGETAALAAPAESPEATESPA